MCIDVAGIAVASGCTRDTSLAVHLCTRIVRFKLVLFATFETSYTRLTAVTQIIRVISLINTQNLMGYLLQNKIKVRYSKDPYSIVHSKPNCRLTQILALTISVTLTFLTHPT